MKRSENRSYVMIFCWTGDSTGSQRD